MNQIKNKLANAWLAIVAFIVVYFINRFLWHLGDERLIVGFAIGAFIQASPCHPKLPDAAHRAYVALIDLLKDYRDQEKLQRQAKEVSRTWNFCPNQQLADEAGAAIRGYMDLVKRSW